MHVIQRKVIKLGFALFLAVALVCAALPGAALAHGGPRRHPVRSFHPRHGVYQRGPTRCYPRARTGYATFGHYKHPATIIRESQKHTSHPSWYYRRVNGRYVRVHLNPRYGTATVDYRRSYRNQLYGPHP